MRGVRPASLAVAFGCGCLILLAAAGALAHQTNLSLGRVVLDGQDVRYRLTLSAHDAAVALGIPTDLISPVPQAAFADKQAAFADYLAQRLQVSADAAPCAAAPPVIDYGPLPAELAAELRFHCPATPRQLTISYNLFFDIDAGHRGIGTIDAGNGAVEYLVDRSFTTIAATIAATAPPRRHIALRFAWLGIEHIAGGIDHLLFLLALLLGASRFANLLAVVTAFTVAHSLTLSLAWFGVLAPSDRWVESAIAISIGAVAVANIAQPAGGRRWPLAFGFGLVHGLGFYGALRQIELPAGQGLGALLGFNVGVEIGQVAAVALLYPVLAWAGRRPWYGRAATAASALLVAIAGAWFVQRAFLA